VQNWRSSLEFYIPIEPVAPCVVQVIGREAFALILQLPACRADWLDMELHMRLLWGAPAFFEVARRAGRRNILPGRTAALCARNDMIERKITSNATILALELVTQKQVESGKSGIL